ncbi:hypothetical protein SCRM01_073c [Synechococcus phage S-CRM01]|uniref:hypothetical protein n=1 Tax=Synechococcus phage S-CRM01 TaxID=1026955 RepID=UPI000209E385|nr:hypothetical protein SCRM01_073c [Synechococcus phage S-CRM01]AEC53019.1 hypothetical protein SCRM01_073c [Synechococcus phage S-CRM01]
MICLPDETIDLPTNGALYIFGDGDNSKRKVFYVDEGNLPRNRTKRIVQELIKKFL